MRNFFVFNGKPSTDFSVWCSGADTMSAPAPIYETTQVAGRNGAVLTPKKSFENVELKYSCFMYRDFKEKFSALKNHLLAETGYKRLEDTFNPDEYREAYVSTEINPSLTNDLDSGTFTVTFSCKPQRFLKSGELVHTMETSDDAMIINPTQMISRPLIRLRFVDRERTGEALTLEVSNGDDSWILKIAVPKLYAGEYMSIDCESRTVTAQDGSLVNSWLDVRDKNGNLSDFPKLKPGQTHFIVNHDDRIYIRDIKVVPRWWRV